jgi:hypothetical protein
MEARDGLPGSRIQLPRKKHIRPRMKEAIYRAQLHVHFTFQAQCRIRLLKLWARQALFG